MVKPLHILEGWYKSKIHADKGSLALSQKRLSICMDCPHAVDSSALKIINGTAETIKTKKCRLCGCPLVEKSLVQNEKCDDNRWIE